MIDRLELESDGWYFLKGRGILFSFNQAPDGIDPRSLVGEDVFINGKSYLIKGVETFAIADPYPSYLPFGLLVSVKEDDA